MGSLERLVTPSLTGEDQLAIHEQEIQMAFDEINRQTDSLDSLNNIFKVSAYGTLTISWNGSTYPPGVYTPGTGVNSTYLAYFTRNDRPGQLYQVPYFEFDGSGNLIFAVNSFSGLGGITFTVSSAAAPIPASVQITAFALLQPSGVASS